MIFVKRFFVIILAAMVACPAAIYWSPEVLWAPHPQKVSKRRSRASRPGVSKKCRKVSNDSKMSQKDSKISVRGLFRHFFDTPGREARERLFETFWGFRGSGVWRLLYMGIAIVTQWYTGQELNTNSFGCPRKSRQNSRDIPPESLFSLGFEGHTKLFAPHPFTLYCGPRLPRKKTVFVPLSWLVRGFFGFFFMAFSRLYSVAPFAPILRILVLGKSSELS